MSMDSPSDTLRRKLAARPAAGAPDSDAAVTLPRAWRLALVHGFAQTVGLAVSVEDQETAPLPSDRLCTLVERGDLAVLLEGPGGFGVAIFDVQMLAVLIEMQTMGRILTHDATPRAPTATDAGLIAAPLDRVLHLFDTHAAALPGSETAWDMRFATQLQDGRAIALALPDAVHVMTDLRLTLGAGTRKGRLRILLPRILPKAEAPDVSARVWAEGLEKGVMECQIALTAVLWRLHMPMDRIAALQVGDTIPIPACAIGEVQLMASTGAPLARGRLGRIGGTKAVALTLDDLPGPAADSMGALPIAGGG